MTLLTGLVAAEVQTTSTLRLEDLFQQSAVAAPAPSENPANARRRLLVERPDLTSWRATPAPPAAPVIAATDLPALSPLPFISQEEVRIGERPLLSDRGLAPGSVRPGMAELVLSTSTKAALVRYEVTAADGASSASIVTLHPPGFEERFLVPEGEYVISRRVWFRENPAASAKTRFPNQRLASGSRYTGETDEGAERDARVTIESIQMRPR